MSIYRLQIDLLSDTTFGRGDGVAGVVDTEVQHDEYGCPYLAGRTLKGLLREECVNLLYALDQAGKAEYWWEPARRLFGEPGSTHATRALLHISDAKLPDDLRNVLAYAVQTGALSRQQVLESLTAIRRQTAVDVRSEAPRQETLRALRVIVRQTTFHALLALEDVLTAKERTSDLALLSACDKALRLAGTGRNRGVGEIRVRLQDEAGQDVTDHYFHTFSKEVSA
ncbi:MAG: RAMP superfamily CRISPR-associated protein [Caldilineaceae bacterium]